MQIPTSEDGGAGSFSALACLGNRGYFGGGEPPATTVPSIVNDDPLACIERKAPFHRTVLQGVGVE